MYYLVVFLAKFSFTAENEPRNVWITDLADHMFRSHIERLVTVFACCTLKLRVICRILLAHPERLFQAALD